MASIGLLDMVESLVLGEDDAINYKEKCLTIVLQSIREADNFGETLKSLVLLGDRSIRGLTTIVNLR